VAEFSRRQLDTTRNVQLLLTKVQDNMFHSRTHLKLSETDLLLLLLLLFSLAEEDGFYNSFGTCTSNSTSSTACKSHRHLYIRQTDSRVIQTFKNIYVSKAVIFSSFYLVVPAEDS
jgi:hypothetical protein